MFDNLREQASSSPFEEEAQFQPAASTAAPPPKQGSPRILGTTGPQRLFLALMLMLVVCLLGTLFLMITGKFGLF